MSDAEDALKSLRDRLAGSGEDRLGKALTELLENPVFTSAVTCAFDARELAVHAQEMALTVLNIPSAADVERLTRRLRSMSQRLEGVEDGLYRLEGLLSGVATEDRLSTIESQLSTLIARLAPPPGAPSQPSSEAMAPPGAGDPVEGAPAPPRRSASGAPAPEPPAKSRPGRTASAPARAAKPKS